jgi:hypothetical protein
LTCSHEFLTAELREQFLEELVELRTALQQIKINAEAYVAESTDAAETLGRLTESLNVLRALRVYQQAPDAGPSASILLSDDEARFARSGSRLAAVQSLRRRTALGLAEALARVDAYLANHVEIA